MPTSNAMFKPETKEYILNKFKDRDISILDVGPGVGAYSDLLRSTYPNMDACEIYEPYVAKYGLKAKYNTVYVSNICDFEFDHYDLIIMGDILEHIEYDKALELVTKLYSKCEELIICVPYNLPAGPWGGNSHEAHIQDDLNPDTMKSRYVMLKEILSQPVYDGRHNCGVYVKNENFIVGV